MAEKYTSWIRPSPRGVYVVCCDCGLTHRFQFRIRSGRVEMRCRRAERQTTEERIRRQRGRRR